LSSSRIEEDLHDLVVVGAGPTGLAIGARARQKNLDVLLMDRGPLVANLLEFPTYMTFFTTKDLLEIADLPFPIPHEKPTRREALAYYRAVAAHYEIPLAPFEEVEEVGASGREFVVVSQSERGECRRRARAVALATGYFHRPRRLGVPGEDLAWVQVRYWEPYRHFDERVAVIGGGNSAVEAALDLWRNHVRVTLVHRGAAVKDTVKYWLKPDLENRIEEGSIQARFETTVQEFSDRSVVLSTPRGPESLEIEAAYVLIGYEPDVELERRCGVEIEPESLVPVFDPESCESNVPGLYIAGTLQSGSDIGRIFIENSRVHADRIVDHLVSRLRSQGRT
jgi:thioredoxin reductase (NADPH)